jgi:hypothetical protein
MKIPTVNQRDLLAGLVFAALGVLGLLFGKDLEYGSLARMGPGYFPFVISVLLLCIGVYLGGSACWSGRAKISWGTPRPILSVLAGMVIFGLLIEKAGLSLAALFIVGLTYIGAWKFRFLEFVVLSFLLILASYLVFVKILAMPLKMIVGV